MLANNANPAEVLKLQQIVAATLINEPRLRASTLKMLHFKLSLKFWSCIKSNEGGAVVWSWFNRGLCLHKPLAAILKFTLQKTS
jgi:hypothetical protein